MNETKVMRQFLNKKERIMQNPHIFAFLEEYMAMDYLCNYCNNEIMYFNSERLNNKIRLSKKGIVIMN